MHTYILLIRGINVGGKNKIPMQALREQLTATGFSAVRTYIASGNAIVRSPKTADVVRRSVEGLLPKYFALDTKLVKVLVLTPNQLRAVINEKPVGFGDEPDRFHSDVVFVIDTPVAEVLPVFSPHDGVDRIWPGNGVIYSERLSAERTKSRLGKIIGTPPYQSMTIRNWNTVSTLAKLTAAD